MVLRLFQCSREEVSLEILSKIRKFSHIIYGLRHYISFLMLWNSPLRAVCTIRDLRYTYVLVSTADHTQDNGIVCVLLKLSSELSFCGVYSGTSGVSGYCSRNRLNPALKHSSVVILRRFDGSWLKSWAALTLKVVS